MDTKSTEPSFEARVLTRAYYLWCNQGNQDNEANYFQALEEERCCDQSEAETETTVTSVMEVDRAKTTNV